MRRNDAYAVFTNATGNSKLPWPDALKEKAPGQVNAFFRWKNISDTKDKLEVALFLTSPADLKTSFEIPREASADVSLRRIQNLPLKPGEPVRWSFGTTKGEIKVDAEGLVTLPGLKITATPQTLTLRR